MRDWLKNILPIHSNGEAIIRPGGAGHPNNCPYSSCACSMVLYLCSKWFLIMNIKNQTYPCVQCAAVITHCSLIRVPPQKTDTLPPFGFDLDRATCQPISPSTASSPPTILWIPLSSSESRSVTSLFWPQTAMMAFVWLEGPKLVFYPISHIKQLTQHQQDQSLWLTKLVVHLNQIRGGAWFGWPALLL